MHVYAKFMKELFNGKHKLKGDENVALAEEYSAVIQHRLPPKLTDPGKFTIPCSISSLKIGQTLCNLGASINLMSLSMIRKLDCGDPKPTKMTFPLADRSITYPYGVLEDVSIKVDDLLFPADVVILDMSKDVETPLLLGRPFLSTDKALIDVEIVELILMFNKEQVIFNVFEAMKHAHEDLQCYQIDLIDKLIENVSIEEKPLSPIENVFVQSIDEIEEDDNDVKVNEMVLQFQSSQLDPAYKVFEELGGSSEDKLTEPKLKELPEHLKYVVLSQGNRHPVIISSTSSIIKEEKFLLLLKENKETLGWNLADLKGIIPAIACIKSNWKKNLNRLFNLKEDYIQK
ncbi:uncharacterized protein LOC127121636 [Lathyrus oleraceus]|uniref:uncharacterized protein LOC127121636 n=1 Tax=Pisum sativum TaxID=3888 RepID=UPI0021D0442E|nr:uncharacterized protein LOC127121636 [Pisum sativum]